MPDPLEQLARRYVTTRLQSEDLTARLSKVNQDLDFVEAQLFDAITQAGLRSYPHDTLGTITPRLQPHATLKKASLDDEGNVQDEDARQQLEAWSKDQGLFDELFYWAVRSPTLKRIVTERLKEGLDAPPGVDYFSERTVTWKRPDEMKKG